MPKRSEKRITKRVVDSLTPEREMVVFDAELRGFGVRAKPGGPKTFLVQYRNVEGRSRRLSLGQYGELTCERARASAKVVLGRVAQGEDPAAERQDTRSALTVAEIGERYFREAEAGRVRGKKGAPKKDSTLLIDRYRWKRHILPLIGSRKARGLTRADIADFLSKAEAQAREAGHAGGGERRLKGLLGGVFTWAAEKNLVESNPTHGVKTRPDGKRRVALDETGYRAVGRAIAEASMRGEPWQAVEAIRLLALTGCRRGEITALRWREVDLNGQALSLGDTKTGASVRPLGLAACHVLRDLRERSDGEFVFPAIRETEVVRPYQGLPNGWRRVAATVTDSDGKPLTLHGLRHAFASVAAGVLNYAEPTVGALIGHAATTMTGRYIHHVDAALIAAADATAGHIAGWLAEGAREARVMTEATTADFDPADEVAARVALDADPLTKVLPPDTREALAKRLGVSLGFCRSGLPVSGKRAKPDAWALDVLTRDCEVAFREAEIATSVWFDDVDDSPFLQFVARLAAARGIETGRASLKSNGLRGRRIIRNEENLLTRD